MESELHSKNIDGCHRIFDSEKRFPIGRDVEGCLRIARAPSGNSKKGRQSGSSMSSSANNMNSSGSSMGGSPLWKRICNDSYRGWYGGTID